MEMEKRCNSSSFGNRKIDLVAWNSVINGFAENGKPNEALGLYSEMMGSKGIKPDGFTIVGLLSACAKIDPK